MWKLPRVAGIGPPGRSSRKNDAHHLCEQVFVDCFHSLSPFCVAVIPDGFLAAGVVRQRQSLILPDTSTHGHVGFTLWMVLTIE
ncbi:hypothetical protein ABIB25_001065 [Nakamurella sp. UYEF19]|uniref:hypothetical protein n=1 Tax=Nakamurella sp. UYEF19 TaxID=1756392 RepID=UPI00339B5A0B